MEKILSTNLKFLRKKHGYNLVQIAALMEVSKSAVSDYENGHSIPGFQLVAQYCKTFNVSLALIGKVIFEEKNYNAGLYIEQQHDPVQSDQYRDLRMKYNLSKQKIEGLNIQAHLMQQLLDAKESENRTLKLQIDLLMTRHKS